MRGFLFLTGCFSLSVMARGAVSQSAAARAAARKAVRRHLAYLKALPPVRGVVFHCCSCSVPCPCMFNDKDVEGCNIVRIFHITDGGFEGKQLAGLTAVYVPHPDDLKNKKDGLRKDGKKVEAALYLPAGLTERQEQSLMGLLADNTMSIGWNTNLKRHVPIRFRKSADGYDVEIPGVFHARTASAKGANGKPIIADNLNLGEGSRWYIGRAAVHDYQDQDEKAWHWNLPKTNGSWTYFAWGPHIDPSDENEANQDAAPPKHSKPAHAHRH